MRDLVEFIVRALVDDEQAAAVREMSRGEETVLEVTVAPAEIGRLIGRQGRTVKAIRMVVAAAEKGGGRPPVVEIVGA